MSQPTVFTLGRGAVLSMAPAGSSSAAVAIKQLKTISFAGKQANYEDITNMDSPAGVAGGAPVQEFAPTTLAPGTAACQGVFNDNDPGQIALAAAQYTQILQAFTLQYAPKAGYATGFMRTFNGYVQECNGPDAQVDKAATLAATLKISGVITDLPGSKTAPAAS